MEPSRRTAGHRRPRSGRHPHDRRDHPDQVLRHLEDVDYPAGKEGLVAAAERAGAPEPVVSNLRAIPPVEYRNRAEVLRSVPAEHMREPR
jgi:hypothetical protein